MKGGFGVAGPIRLGWLALALLPGSGCIWHTRQHEHHLGATTERMEPTACGKPASFPWCWKAAANSV